MSNPIYNVKFKGIDDLINQLEDMTNTSLPIAQQEALKFTCKSATKDISNKAPVNTKKTSRSVHFKVYKHAINGVGRAKVYINAKTVPYLYFVYYGTGKYATQSRYGKGQGVKNRWWVPEEKMGAHADKYGYRKKTGLNGRVYYLVYGQKPKPFINEAFKDNKDKYVKYICEVYKKWLRIKY